MQATVNNVSLSGLLLWFNPCHHLVSWFVEYVSLQVYLLLLWLLCFLCFLFCLLLAFLWGRFFLGLSAAPSCLLANVSKRSLAVLRICSTWRTLVSVTFRNHSHFRVRHNKSTNHLPPYPFPFSTHFMVINKAISIYPSTKSSAGPSQFWNNLQVDTRA